MKPGGRQLRVWILWAIGAVVLVTMPFALLDPGILVLVGDPELVALIVTSSVAFLRETLSRQA
jgi:hypothetical protein